MRHYGWLYTNLKFGQLLWHTNQGSQYAAQEHRNLLSDLGIIQSMSRRGNCWDNAVAESCFRSLKVECVNGYSFKTRAEAQQVIFEYIQVFYNQIRLYSANGYLPPAEYERKLQARLKYMSGKVLTYQ